MWFLARRELIHGKSRFLLVVGLVTLVSFLVFVMTGLATGLGDASVSGVRKLTATADLVVYAPDVQRSMARSDLPTADAERVTALPGVKSVTPVGQAMVNLASPTGSTFTVALIGNGSGLDQPGTVIMDESARSTVAEGDIVTVQPGGVELRVVGFDALGSIQHTTAAYTDLATWQRIRYATVTDGTVPERASALLVTTSPNTTDSVSAAISEAGLDPATPREAVEATPGYQEETGTIALIRGFLFAIAALLIGTIFWVLTIQKEPALAVLRAAGAGRGMLIGAYTIEVGVTTVVGTCLGWLTAGAAAQVLPDTAYVLRLNDAAIAALLLVAFALAASASSARRLFTIDPLLSLGQIS